MAIVRLVFAAASLADEIRIVVLLLGRVVDIVLVSTVSTVKEFFHWLIR